MLVTLPFGAGSNIALWRAKIKTPVELVVGDFGSYNIWRENKHDKNIIRMLRQGINKVSKMLILWYVWKSKAEFY